MGKVKLDKMKSEIVALEDGFRYFFPTKEGALSAMELRIIAAELDRQNAEWYAHVQQQELQNTEAGDALTLNLNTGEEKGMVEALDMIDLLVDEVKAYQEPRRPTAPISKFEKYVAQERRPLMSQRPSADEIEFLASANAFGGEAGELQDAVKKILRSDSYDADASNGKTREYWQDFLHEAGDVLHYFVRLLTHAGYTLEEVMQANINKLEARKLTNETKTCQFTVSSSPFEL